MTVILSQLLVILVEENVRQVFLQLPCLRGTSGVFDYAIQTTPATSSATNLYDSLFVGCNSQDVTKYLKNRLQFMTLTDYTLHIELHGFLSTISHDCYLILDDTLPDFVDHKFIVDVHDVLDEFLHIERVYYLINKNLKSFQSTIRVLSHTFDTTLNCNDALLVNNLDASQWLLACCEL